MILEVIRDRVWLPEDIEAISSKYALEGHPPPLEGVPEWIDAKIRREHDAAPKRTPGKQRRYSDNSLLARAQTLMPARYSDRRQVEHTGHITHGTACALTIRERFPDRPVSGGVGAGQSLSKTT